MDFLKKITIALVVVMGLVNVCVAMQQPFVDEQVECDACTGRFSPNNYVQDSTATYGWAHMSCGRNVSLRTANRLDSCEQGVIIRQLKNNEQKRDVENKQGPEKTKSVLEKAQEKVKSALWGSACALGSCFMAKGLFDVLLCRNGFSGDSCLLETSYPGQFMVKYLIFTGLTALMIKKTYDNYKKVTQ